MSFRVGLLLVLALKLTTGNGQWTKTDGPEGGAVEDLVVDGTTIFAATLKGVFRLEENSTAWTSSSSGLGQKNVFSLWNKNGVLFAGTNNGLFRSNDGGNTWSPVDSGLTGAIISITSNGTTLIAASYSKVVQSNNDGETWTEITGTLSIGNIISVKFINGNLFAVCSTTGIYQYTGSSWVSKNSGLTGSYTNGITSIGGTLFVVKNASVFTSTNNGDTWSLAGSPPASSISCIQSIGTALFAAGSDGIFKSDNNGVTWSPVNFGLSDIPITAIIELNQQLYAATAGGGVYRSTDASGSFWTTLNTDLPFSNVSALHLLDNGTLLAGTYRNGLFKSSDSGLTWTSIPSVASLDITCIYKSETALYVGTFAEGLFQSVDDGATWASFGPTIQVNSITQKENALYVAAKDGIYRYENSTWTKLNSLDHFSTIATKDGYLYAGSYTSGIYYSWEGTTWTQSDPNINFQVWTIEVFQDKLYAGTDEGVFESSDGMTWVSRDNQHNQDLRFVRDIAEQDGLLYAATWNGVLQSIDNGYTWRLINSEIQNRYVNTLVANGNILFAGTYGDGLLTRDISPSLSYASAMESFTNTIGTPSQVQNFTVTADLLQGNVYINAPSGFEISQSSSSNFSSSLAIITGFDEHIETTIYVRFNPGDLDPINDFITLTCNGMATQQIAVSGVAHDKSTQTINFSPIEDKTFGDPSFGLEGTTTSGLAVSYTSSDPTIATINTNIVTILKAGSVVITATQAGNSEYYAGEATQPLTINKASQSITFDGIPDKNSDDESFELVAESNSGLPVTFQTDRPDAISISGNEVSIIGTGEVSITATQEGDGNYLAADAVTKTFTINLVLGNEEGVSPFYVYPNPTSGWVKLVGDRTISALTLINMLGQSEVVEWKSNEANLSSLRAGIYLLKFQEGVKSYTISILKK